MAKKKTSVKKTTAKRNAAPADKERFYELNLDINDAVVDSVGDADKLIDLIGEILAHYKEQRLRRADTRPGRLAVSRIAEGADAVAKDTAKKTTAKRNAKAADIKRFQKLGWDINNAVVDSIGDADRLVDLIGEVLARYKVRRLRGTDEDDD